MIYVFSNVPPVSPDRKKKVQMHLIRELYLYLEKSTVN